MFLSIVPVIAATATLSLTPLIQRLGLQWNYIDQPGKRKIHQQSIVRIGGIAIFLGTLLAIILMLLSNYFDNSSMTSLSPIIGILLGATGFFGIGLIDDMFQLSPFIRLFLQGVVACLSWALGVRVEILPVPLIGVVPTGIFSLPMTFLWLAGVANAINWLDGLDGLAGGVSAIATLALSLICWHYPPLALLALALAGSLVGFLYYNVNPARIFMGDGGSYFIGFTLAAIGAVGLMQTPTFAVAMTPFWVLAVPIADMVRVIASRLWDKKSPFFPDQRHLHHKLLQAKLSVRAAVRLIWTLTAWFATWAMLMLAIPHSPIALCFTSCLLVITSFPLWRVLLPTAAQFR
ncbi:glycosyltransferase family 4 protein [Pantanalinema rosaneae CENA516]|uniref:glycosyltransferase family 4 protein n=1 Tax=Pantanalinema rosaneae TaxID=1620701 RepID=UPI003D6EC085